MRSFDPNFFRRLAFEPENGLMDRKSRLYTVYGRGTRNGLAEFVKDMIALANTSRRRGEPAYLLFGVRDKPLETETDSEDEYRGPFPGILDQCSKERLPRDWEQSSLERQQTEIIGRDYQRVIAEHVRPLMDFEYLYGYVDERLVSYIVIEYNQHEQPFEVAKRLADREKVYLKVGQCWQRIGESNRIVQSHEKKSLYRNDDAPYVPKSAWESHFEQCLITYDNTADPEIPLSVRDVRASHQRDWDNSLSQFLREGETGVMLLVGGPGTGKTTKLQQEMYRLSSELLANLEASHPEEQPVEPIPVYVRLEERRFDSDQAFKDELVARLDEFSHLGLRQHPQPYSILQRGEYRFVILVDGLDEIETSQASQTLVSIRSVIENSPREIQYIVSGRTEGIPSSWLERYDSFKIEPVERQKLYNFLNRTLDTGPEAASLLSKDSDLLQLFNSPLAAQSFKKLWHEWENLEQEFREQVIEYEQRLEEYEQRLQQYYENPDEYEEDIEEYKHQVHEDTLAGYTYPDDPPQPSVAEAIQTMLEDLLRHDLAKGLIRDESALYRQLTRLGQLALWLKVNRQESASIVKVDEILEEDGHRYCKRLHLLRNEEGRVSFENLLLLDYFAVYRIRELLETSADTTSLTWARCGEMLSELISNLLDPLIDGYVRSHPEIKEDLTPS